MPGSWAQGSGQLRVNGLSSADRIEVVDEVTVRLHLDRPVAWGLIGNALLSSSSIVHAREIMKHATADDPYGTRWLETKTVESGAFVIETWQKGSMMSLVPNPHAFQPSKLERIVLQVVPDASPRASSWNAAMSILPCNLPLRTSRICARSLASR